MLRNCWKDVLTVASGQTTSGFCEIRTAAYGVLLIPSTFDGSSITFTVADQLDDRGTTPTFYTLKDASTGSAISITVAASQAVALPAELFGGSMFKLVCGTNQSSTSTVFTVILKS